MSYTATGTETGTLHFYSVKQTIREAGKIPFETFANRISGSVPTFLIALVGYMVLVWRHRLFLLALPLIGIGGFAYWGGLRFTVYAVPIAAMAAVYLFYYLAEIFIENRWARLGAVALATAALIYPNIIHIIGYRVPTVFSKAEVADIVKLNEKASPKDYTLTWWDYGYPIWFYSNTNTLIDGGKHNRDNFIVSTILQTDSAKLAARLARLSVETYVSSVNSYQQYLHHDYKLTKMPSQFLMRDRDGKIFHNGSKAVVNVLFRSDQPDQKDPNLFLAELESGAIKLPAKTRDIYLYMPYKMIDIFPTVMVFGNLDLISGKPKRKAIFYPSYIRSEQDGIVHLRNGIILNLKSGILQMGAQSSPLAKFVIAEVRRDGSIDVTQRTYHIDGNLVALYLKSYGKMIVMDRKTFDSIFVQMFMLGRYDPDLFEPVVTSLYSRIYRVKI
jgi:dolichyl-diphosphooligosaccharide--protein glycosyltransferase/undecaprenyl-diphosphooligosaccharide--protein glycosyltransferase